MKNYKEAYPPEKLNLYDRFFNRYRKIPIEQGRETWHKWHQNYWNRWLEEFTREFVVYEIVDRLTGSVEIKKVYN